MAVRPGDREGWRRVLGGGAAAGVLGGVFIAAILVVMNLMQGRGFWAAFKGAGAPFLGERAMQPGFDAVAVLVGALCHFAISIGWGILFAALVYGVSRGATVALGIAWGVVVWLGMYYVVLPLAGLGEMASASPVGLAVLNHLVFGLGVGLGFAPYQPRIPHAGRLERGAPAPGRA
jgi:hypothetical protein